MAQASCEMMWLGSLPSEFGVQDDRPMTIRCDNQTAIFITNNPTFHERIKYIKIDCHYVRDMVLFGDISTPYTQLSKQLADIFTKGLSVGVFHGLYNKLGMLDIFAPA